MSLSELREIVMDREARRAEIHGVAKSRTWLSDWTELNWMSIRETKAFLAAQTVKNLPGMRETWVWSLSWEDPLEEDVATHSSILAWRISGTEKPGRLQSRGLQRVEHYWVTKSSTQCLSRLTMHQVLLHVLCMQYLLLKNLWGETQRGSGNYPMLLY